MGVLNMAITNDMCEKFRKGINERIKMSSDLEVLTKFTNPEQVKAYQILKKYETIKGWQKVILKIIALISSFSAAATTLIEIFVV